MTAVPRRVLVRRIWFRRIWVDESASDESASDESGSTNLGPTNLDLLVCPWLAALTHDLSSAVGSPVVVPDVEGAIGGQLPVRPQPPRPLGLTGASADDVSRRLAAGGGSSAGAHHSRAVGPPPRRFTALRSGGRRHEAPRPAGALARRRARARRARVRCACGPRTSARDHWRAQPPGGDRERPGDRVIAWLLQTRFGGRHLLCHRRRRAGHPRDLCRFRKAAYHPVTS